MEFDYTAKRLGSKQPPYNKKVVQCQKCGQRGTDDGRWETKGRKVKAITHRSHIEVVAGIPFNRVDEHCAYFEDEYVGEQKTAVL